MNNLTSIQSKSRKRIGRGLSAGQGKTAGRGTKGQKSRSGHNIPRRFEGGQTPISMRLPKLPGFKSQKRKNVLISLTTISGYFKNGEIVSKTSLVEKGLINPKDTPKVLNNGELTKTVSFDASVLISKSVLDQSKKTAKATPAPSVSEQKEAKEPADKKESKEE